MDKTLIAAILCLAALPALAQQPVPPPADVTDLQLQAARADSAEKAAAFNKLAYERILADARKLQAEMGQAAAAKDAWWGKCAREPSCIEWVNSGPVAHETPPEAKPASPKKR